MESRACTLDCEAVRRDGYAIVRNLFEPGLCNSLCQCIDTVIGPSPLEVANTPQLEDVDRALRSRVPIVQSGNYRHTLRQPIFSYSLAEAAIAGGVVEMVAALLRSPSRSSVRLMQQMLVRTDASPDAIQKGRSEPTGWHIDTAFLPEHYTATPQANVYHVLTALNDVPSGGGAFRIVPGAFEECRTYTQTHASDLEHLQDSDFRTILRPLLMLEAVGDTSCAQEVLLGQGDSVIFDLMSTHSASSNCIHGYSRYVLFQTYFDVSASYSLLPVRGASLPPSKFPAEFREALPVTYQFLLDWAVPDHDRGSKPSEFWGLSKEKLQEKANGGAVMETYAAFGDKQATPSKL